jgi:DNA invertase Pin-like site-specific DNA recombinase
MANGLFVGYFRVSTDRQGLSGLGLEAQHKAVSDYLNGGKWEMVGEFVEVESGKRSDRPELGKALMLCRQRKATLIVAKLDRLARNVHFVSGLMESGVDFVAVDMPHANRLTIHILAAVAEHERQCISDRTKAALAAAKARGTKLGNPNLATNNAAVARKHAETLRPIVAEIRKQGIRSARGIADELNRREVPAARGSQWHANSVNLMLHRLDHTRPKEAGRTRRARCRARLAPRSTSTAPAR